MAPPANQIVYVQNGGNDSTGTGAITAPYLTISKALSVVTGVSGASQTKRYDINIGPGLFNETANGITLPANVFLQGTDKNLTVIQISSMHLGTGFVQNNDDQVGLADLSLVPSGIFTASFNFTGSSGPNTQGKLFMENCIIDSDISITITGQQDATRATLTNVAINGNISVNNMFLFEADQSHFYQNLTCSSLTGLTLSASAINLKNTTIDGNFIAQANSGRTMTVTALNSTVGGSLTIDGPSTSLSASSNFIPNRGVSAFSNGSTVTLNNDAIGVAYSPTGPTNWITQPATVQEALDILAGNVQNLLISSGSQEIDINLPLSGISAVANTPHIYTILGKTVQLAGQIVVTASQDIDTQSQYQFRVVPPANIVPGSWTSNISGQFSITGLANHFETYGLTVGLDSTGVLLGFTSISILFTDVSILISYNVSFTLA